MKKILLLRIAIVAVLSLGFSTIQGQQALLSAGINSSGSGGSLNSSMGQIMTSSISSQVGYTVLPGVQQPLEISVSTGIPENIKMNIDVRAFPNPATDFLTVNVLGDVNWPVQARLYSVHGKLLKTQSLTSSTSRIKMQDLAPAIYFLKVTAASQRVETLRITKLK